MSRSTLMRPTGGWFCEPELLGTAIQWPFTLARYSFTSLVGPYFAISRCTTSSTGSKARAWLCTSHTGIAIASWPVFACSSAAAVITSLLPALM